MIAITVLNKANVPTGPFTREQVAEKLKSGEFSLSDLAFVEGLAQWTPLDQVLAKVDATTPPPPAAIPPISAPAANAPAYSYAATMQPPGHLVYGGFWLRFVAYILDGLILSIPLFILCGIFGAIVVAVVGVDNLSHTSTDLSSKPEMTPMASIVIGFGELILWAVIIIIGWLYFAKLESGPHQATFGKRALGLKVTNLAGDRLGFGQASGRFFGKIISGMTFYIGFIMAGFTERKQALHDMIAGTLVVRK